jgi:adenylate kinase family enzyme
MEEKIKFIREWLGAGAINIFGLPMSGKDTVGERLAGLLGAKFLSSGAILREHQNSEGGKKIGNIDKGELAPSGQFFNIVLPYFSREDLKGVPLILSSVGRLTGEEFMVVDSLSKAGHPLKAAIALNVSENDVRKRWETAKTLDSLDRGRADDQTAEIFETRLKEFRFGTLPVLASYHSMGTLLQVKADMTREEVFSEVVNQLYQFALSHSSNKG